MCGGEGSIIRERGRSKLKRNVGTTLRKSAIFFIRGALCPAKVPAVQTAGATERFPFLWKFPALVAGMSNSIPLEIPVVHHQPPLYFKQFLARDGATQFADISQAVNEIDRSSIAIEDEFEAF